MAYAGPVIDNLIHQLLEDESQIPASRLSVLDSLTDYITQQVKNKNPVHLGFICTHNSRRSQIAQVWAHTAATVFDIPNIVSCSGGTEATQFHSNAVRALQTLGFRINRSVDQSDPGNPRYEVVVGTGIPTLICFSKRIEEMTIVDTGFTAIMTCSEADQNCPVVPGSQARFPLPYEDPKRFDGSKNVQQEYLNTAVEIGREIIRVFGRV